MQAGGLLRDGADLPGTTLVLGGARSGKSALAERLVLSAGLRPLYIATGRAWDDEMASRIADHRDRRGPAWTTIEEPLALADALERHAAPDAAILVDCLTLWVTNLMLAERDVDGEGAALAALLPGLPGRIVVASNEVGLGIVPDNAMARAFRDHAGRLNQAVAAVATQVVFTAAGLPLVLKPVPETLP
jgi:adenosylcobinamide kinase/adenosylcobinamide-phosphate guanylyltransferase